MVSIAAFQAVDPGSIPGHRRHHLDLVGQVVLGIKCLGGVVPEQNVHETGAFNGNGVLIVYQV